MGSGKGRARRAQVVAGSGQAMSGARFGSDSRKWHEFVSGAGLRGVDVAEYYGEDYSEDAGRLRLLEGVFADMVSVGAIILPEPYEVEDFVFELVGSEPVAYLRGKPEGAVDLTGALYPKHADWSADLVHACDKMLGVEVQLGKLL
jgi:hypothetical protein